MLPPVAVFRFFGACPIRPELNLGECDRGVKYHDAAHGVRLSCSDLKRDKTASAVAHQNKVFVATYSEISAHRLRYGLNIIFRGAEAGRVPVARKIQRNQTQAGVQADKLIFELRSIATQAVEEDNTGANSLPSGLSLSSRQWRK